MSSIVIGCIPAHGHVTPMLSVARSFVQRGDDVRFITGSRFADKVHATGASFVPLPPDTVFDTHNGLAHFPERVKLKGAKAVAFDLEHVFARPAQGQYETVMAVLDEQSADGVLVDPAFTGASLLLGHPRSKRPAIVMCGVAPLPVSSRDTAPFGTGLPPARLLNRQRNTALAALTSRLLAGANGVANEFYRRAHGRDLPYSLIDWGSYADAIVQFTVAAFEYPRSDAPAALYFAGPLSATGSQAELPDWWSDLDGPRPVIHVTQGTLANTDYRQLIAPTLDALAREDVLVVVSTGGRPLETLPQLPDNARAAEYLPYDELLPRTAVFVTNGGYGGVQYALRYGVPIVATGGKEDKPEVGARVAWAGVGRRIRSERPASSALRRDILAVLDQPRYRQASRRIAAQMAAAPGFACLANVVDKLAASAP